jgi:lysophospholipase L1-like esterase
MRTFLLILLTGVTVGTLALPGKAGTEAALAATSSPTYYVSLGDSYSVGYQPGLGATPGYAGYVAAHTGLTLKNFGCSGATTTSILLTMGCPFPLQHTPGGVNYPTRTQIAAAEAFIAGHQGHIGLITVTIGGNDVDGCGRANDPIACVRSVLPDIQTNVTTLAIVLRAAAGPNVPIIGSTYPGVILGAYANPSVPPSALWVNLAQLSVVAFRQLVNPSLDKAYSSVGGSLVDVTKATDAYVPLSRTVHTAAYGTLPVAVARACALTQYCAKGDIHGTTSGYDLIGKLIVAQYRVLRRKSLR